MATPQRIPIGYPPSETEIALTNATEETLTNIPINAEFPWGVASLTSVVVAHDGSNSTVDFRSIPIVVAGGDGSTAVEALPIDSQTWGQGGHHVQWHSSLSVEHKTASPTIVGAWAPATSTDYVADAYKSVNVIYRLRSVSATKLRLSVQCSATDTDMAMSCWWRLEPV